MKAFSEQFELALEVKPVTTRNLLADYWRFMDHNNLCLHMTCRWDVFGFVACADGSLKSRHCGGPKAAAMNLAADTYGLGNFLLWRVSRYCWLAKELVPAGPETIACQPDLFDSVPLKPSKSASSESWEAWKRDNPSGTLADYFSREEAA